ncbi:Oidioi.mRNA.OKI2018_I69.PAR.g11434.t1.cds [Oikopleura dioica]|uniref:Oidioi.mRNA.OKI2018_I69.PAR.g11434.t1.cds n=1 Tax=Oikopleura dioica TaxID=34765 RepID=A0ABN7RVM3_OIKDI|nr:Oidioi.mRNA.OKI2018_I69.PAR.g11434.t1.cds [Oikopleura dioica]
MFEESEEDSDYSEDNRKTKSKRNRKSSEKNSRDTKEKDYDRGRSRYDSPDRGNDRPQLKRYTLMNDDEEFNASPNEYYTDSEEEENHQKDRRNHQVKEEGSSFGRDQIVNASVLRPSRSRHEPTNMQDEDVTPGNAMNFFKQMAKKNNAGGGVVGGSAVPASVSSAASMFGGQVRRTMSRGENRDNSAPVGISKMKSVARERSESRDRTNHRNRSIERTRTRGESRERTRITQRGERMSFKFEISINSKRPSLLAGPQICQRRMR